MAAVMTLQALHDFSDRETAEAVRFDVRWKAAIGAALDDPGFDPSTLVYWRKRIAKSARPHRVNDAVKTVVEQIGVLKGRRRRTVDSTIWDLPFVLPFFESASCAGPDAPESFP